MSCESPESMMRVRFIGYVVYVEGEFYRGEGIGGGCYGAVELVQSSKEAGSLVAISVEFCLDDVELKTIMLASVSCSQIQKTGYGGYLVIVYHNPYCPVRLPRQINIRKADVTQIFS
jgi:hypothetical protein